MGFFGREYELNLLENLKQKRIASLLVIRGRRRIGKSRLVDEFSKNALKTDKLAYYKFAGLPPTAQTTAQSERDEFARQLAKNFRTALLKAEDWGDLFSFLARETKQGRVLILLDEISWMGSKDPDFLGKLKNAWDMEFKENAELILILCGSVSAWIEDNILKNTGFVGRLSLALELKELSLVECNQMLNAIGFRGNAYEKLKILSITGGIPRYLEEIKKDRLADENIKDLCFTAEGILFREFEEIFVDIFLKRAPIYKEIIESLLEGPQNFAEIVAKRGTHKNGHLSEYLKDLIRSGFVKKAATWDLRKGKPSSLIRYRLSDNYVRFYLKYIEKNRQKIEDRHFNMMALSNLPGFSSMMGLQFENLVLNNREFIWKKLHIFPENIVMDNPYFQRAQIRQAGCQIDYLIQMKTKVLYLCELKFSLEPLDQAVIQEVKEKMNRIVLPRGFSILPVLVHVNGVNERVKESEYFSHLIDFNELLSAKPSRVR